MEKFNVIRVTFRATDQDEAEHKVETELDRYVYGFHAHLGLRPMKVPGPKQMWESFWLVQDRYAQSTCDRLMSGLFGAGLAQPDERRDLGL